MDDPGMTRAEIAFSTARQIRGKTAAEDFTLSLVDSSVASGSGTPGTQTIKDITYTTNLPSNTYRKSDVVPASLPEISPVYASLTPSVCAVSQAGAVSRVADGACSIAVASGTDVRRIDQTISTVAGALQYTTPVTLGTGSLRKYLMDQQLAAFSGLSPGASPQAAFSGSSVNTNCLVRRVVAGYTRPPLDVLDQLLVGAGGPATAFHPWRAWITPYHYLTWLGHVNGPDTSTQKWVQELVVVYSATQWTGSLVKLLPADYATAKLPALANDGSVRSLGSYIACWARLANVYETGQSYWVQPVNFGAGNPAPAADARLAWQKSTGGVMATGGDSGSPIWTQVNGDLVLLSHVQNYGAAGGSQDYSQNVAAINSALAALAANGTYTVGVVDISSFNNY